MNVPYLADPELACEDGKLPSATPLEASVGSLSEGRVSERLAWPVAALVITAVSALLWAVPATFAVWLFR